MPRFKSSGVGGHKDQHSITPVRVLCLPHYHRLPHVPTEKAAGGGSAQKPKKNILGGPSPPSRATATPSAKKKTALATSAPKMAEEEWAALFRNNLLRSCWKPGLNSEEVQHVLTLWERKLVEVAQP